MSKSLEINKLLREEIIKDEDKFNKILLILDEIIVIDK
jgi:hypothetical protein